MNIISFAVEGNPIALKRHRTFIRGKIIGQYDPSKGDKSDFLAIALSKCPTNPIDTEVSLRLTFVFPRPEAHFGRKGGEKYVKDKYLCANVIKRPDIDNLIKFVMDALNGRYWKDDSIIYSVEAVKTYGTKPQTCVEIKY